MQKILLVDDQDEEVAIQALMNGVIQYFICKQDFGWEEQLFEALQNAQ